MSKFKWGTRPVAAQFLPGEVIALFEIERTGDAVRIASEKHYLLVPPGEITEADLQNYRNRLAD
jgi:hypothetical protein